MPDEVPRTDDYLVLSLMGSLTVFSGMKLDGVNARNLADVWEPRDPWILRIVELPRINIQNGIRMPREGLFYLRAVQGRSSLSRIRIQGVSVRILLVPWKTFQRARQRFSRRSV